eukprot:scaffold229405_cov19-Tisochrysis_lutea.AAC.1
MHAPVYTTFSPLPAALLCAVGCPRSHPWHSQWPGQQPHVAGSPASICLLLDAPSRGGGGWHGCRPLSDQLRCVAHSRLWSLLSAAPPGSVRKGCLVCFARKLVCFCKGAWCALHGRFARML